MNKFSKMKVHWWTCNHCLFAAYLANVAIGYGWISDTKFKKFSDKDCLWICKIFFWYGSGVKKSISPHLWCAPASPAAHFIRSTARIWQDISVAWFCSCNLLWRIDECVYSHVLMRNLIFVQLWTAVCMDTILL